MENLTTAQPQLRKKKLRTNNNFIDRGMNISTVQQKKNHYKQSRYFTLQNNQG